MSNLKILFLLLCNLWFFASLSFAQTTETIEISTYYPAPYGSYSELQLYPKSTPSLCDANSRGTMYYDDSSNQVMVCKDIGVGYSWSVIGQGGFSNFAIFDVAGTYSFSIPTGITKIMLEVWGAGDRKSVV